MNISSTKWNIGKVQFLNATFPRNMVSICDVVFCDIKFWEILETALHDLNAYILLIFSSALSNSRKRMCYIQNQYSAGGTKQAILKLFDILNNNL